MGTTNYSFVPKLSEFPDKEAKIKEIVDWLSASEIIEAGLSHCVLGMEGLGHAPSHRAEFVVIEPELLPFKLNANGLEIRRERSIYASLETGLDKLICPTCNEDISSNNWDFFNEWHSRESNNLTCPICKTPSNIHDYHYEPEWGFSDLGFTFWNWPEFRPEFITEFEKKLGCKISVVYAHI